MHGVGRTVDTEGLLLAGLVASHLAQLALVLSGIEILTRNADGKVAVSNGLGALTAGGSVHWTGLAGSLAALFPVGADLTFLAVSVNAELAAVLTVGPAVILGERLLGASGETHATQLTAELALQRLVLPVATVETETRHLVVSLASRAFQLAVVLRGGALHLGYFPLGTLVTGALLVVSVVESDGAFRANLFSFVEVSSFRTRNTLIIHHHLARLALETCIHADGAGVKESSRQSVRDVESLMNKNNVEVSR